MTAACSAVRASGFARNAPKRALSRCGIGWAARSRTTTLPRGLAWRHCSTKRLASWLDWPLSPKMLERICRSVFIGGSLSIGESEASLFAKLFADARDPGFAALERLRARVHRVVAKDERVRVLGGGA